MTLRITVEIVPHGEESEKYTIGVVDVHNVIQHGLGFCEYQVELTEEVVTYAEGLYTGIETTVLPDLVKHSRQDGYKVLVKKVFERLAEE